MAGKSARLKQRPDSRFPEYTMTGDYIAHYREYGYAVVENLFRREEVAELAAAFDRVYAEALKHPGSYRHQNVFFRITNDARLGRMVRLVQWPSYFDVTLDRCRIDPRTVEILAPHIGPDLKQIINQLHWKPPGAAMAEFGYHQDVRFRRPRSAFRDLPGAYVQTGIAIDPHVAGNGCMRVVPGSHLMGELPLGGTSAILHQRANQAGLRRVGIDPGPAGDLVLAPRHMALRH